MKHEAGAKGKHGKFIPGYAPTEAKPRPIFDTSGNLIPKYASTEGLFDKAEIDADSKDVSLENVLQNAGNTALNGMERRLTTDKALNRAVSENSVLSSLSFDPKLSTAAAAAEANTRGHSHSHRVALSNDDAFDQYYRAWSPEMEDDYAAYLPYTPPALPDNNNKDIQGDSAREVASFLEDLDDEYVYESGLDLLEQEQEEEEEEEEKEEEEEHFWAQMVQTQQKQAHARAAELADIKKTDAELQAVAEAQIEYAERLELQLERAESRREAALRDEQRLVQLLEALEEHPKPKPKPKVCVCVCVCVLYAMRCARRANPPPPLAAPACPRSPRPPQGLLFLLLRTQEAAILSCLSFRKLEQLFGCYRRQLHILLLD